MHSHDAHFVAALLHVAFDLSAAFAQLSEESHQRSRCRVVIFQRLIEKLVERIGGFHPQASQHAFAHLPVVAVEQLRKELVGRQEVGFRAPAHQQLSRFRKARRGLCLSEQRRPQLTLAVVSERHEVVVAKAEQRRLEHSCQCQIVFGQRQKIAECHEVLHGDLVDQRQPIGTGDRNPACLQRCHHLRRKGPPPSHQDEDVGWPDRPVLGCQ